ncbi:MAG: hypothetical protein IJA61_04410 [Clostridia bacterium]|nr:hypothetical protein [Clostridia bacterium]
MNIIEETNIKIINFCKEKFNNDLLFIILGGSAGKNAYIDGWSDIDYYIITKSNQLSTIRTTKEFFKDYPVHIGLTFLSLEELNKGLLIPRCMVTFYEIKNGLNKLIYSSSDFNLSNLKNINVFDNVKYEISNVIFGIKNSKYTEFRPLFKQLVLLKKLYLRMKGYVKYGYKEIDECIKQVFPEDKNSLIDIFDNRNNISVEHLYSLVEEYIELLITKL